jgi:acyl-CoA thioester hydrolase
MSPGLWRDMPLNDKKDPSLPEDIALEDFRFRHRLRVRYAEIDAQAVVYNSHYMVYYDIGITEYLRQFSFNQVEHAARTGHDFHLVSSRVDYRRPIRYDTQIDVAVAAPDIGNSSITWSLALVEASGISLLSTGEIIWVYTNLTEETAVRVPDDLRELFSGSARGT